MICQVAKATPGGILNHDFDGCLVPMLTMAVFMFTRADDRAANERALRELSEFRETKANVDFAHYNRGLALMHNKDFDGAIAEFERTLAVDDTFMCDHLASVQAKKEAGDNKGAIQVISKAIEMDNKRSRLYFTRVQCGSVSKT